MSEMEAQCRAALLAACRRLHLHSADERVPPAVWLDADDVTAVVVRMIEATAAAFDDSRHSPESAYPAALAAAQEKP